MEKVRSYVPDLEDQVEEAQGLARSIGLRVLDSRTVRITKPNPGTLLGAGLCDEIGEAVALHKPELVIVNHTLSPVQQRNLERAWRVKVIDRTGLILEIFGARAQTREGRIQVDLALLEYQKSRLVRSWTHLERQRGGLGKTGGPGEKQLEIDRRLVSEKIDRLKKDLEQVRKNRALQRRSRERTPFPIIALVGYTNAGKSTLFNRMTGASVFAEDLPFATLDPTLRQIKLANGQIVIMADTVGFIADLPTHMVAAFRATLEQVQYADVILHVRDMASHGRDAQKEDVILTLAELGIDHDRDPRMIEVMNKLDALPPEERDDLQNRAHFAERVVAISALDGQGIETLLAEIEKIVARHRRVVSFRLPVMDGGALAWLHRNSHILERSDTDQHIHVTLEIEPADLGRFTERFSYQPAAPDAIMAAEEDDNAHAAPC